MTISKSNFVVISITMITVLFLFLFSNLSTLYTSKATNNSNQDNSVHITANQTIENTDLVSSISYTTAIVGKEKDSKTQLAKEWCIYVKRSFCQYDDLSTFHDNLSQHCKFLIVNADEVNTTSDIDILIDMTKLGINIIFTSLPDTSIIDSSEKLQRILGIKRVISENFYTNGITFFEGFLLGGKTTYHKMKKHVPYFELTSGTKTYAVGEMKNQTKKKVKNEELPPVIWRAYYDNSFVFAVNSDFFEDHTGLGMLTSMLSETNEYFVYPVVNAQSIVFQNYPYLSNENAHEMSKQYFHSTKSFCENVLWPDIVSILSSTGDKFTGMIAPKLEYSHSDEEILAESMDYYFRQNEKISGELGISGDQMESKSFYEVKLEQDSKTLKKLLPDYTFTVFSPGKMPESIYGKYINTTSQNSILSNINTIIVPKETDKNAIISFYNENVLSMADTIDGFSHTDEEDLYLRSIETALGYSCASLDFTRLIYPTYIQDDWTKLSQNFSRYLDTYWTEFREAFDQVTVSDADKKARQFLALSYNSFRQNDTITLSITNFYQEASFILNLSNEKIVSVSDGTFTQIEQNKYIVTASKKDVIIKVTADVE